MSDGEMQRYAPVSEEEFEPILELLQGGDAEAVARKTGIPKERLLQMRDAFLAQVEAQQRLEEAVVQPKVGRNEPCPCGSGRKYKHCCLKTREQAERGKAEEVQERKGKRKEERRLTELIDETFALVASGRYDEAIGAAKRLLKTYQNEDRLHDIMATGHLYAGRCEEAIDICERRLQTAKEEKAYFIEHGRYRDAEVEKPALSYYYPPMTWLQKYWIALKARDYRSLYPEVENPEIAALVKEFESADDVERFPERHTRGYEIRKEALQPTLQRLKDLGPEVIPYLLPVACRYCWAGLFVPEILSHYDTELAVRTLIDISMFGFAFASGASLHALEQKGGEAIPYIEEAFSRDKEFDPIKTGIVSVLGNIPGRGSYDLLLKLLEHESSHIVNWAGDALGNFGNPEALPAMIAAHERIGGEHMIDEAIQKLREGETTE